MLDFQMEGRHGYDLSANNVISLSAWNKLGRGAQAKVQLIIIEDKMWFLNNVQLDPQIQMRTKSVRIVNVTMSQYKAEHKVVLVKVRMCSPWKFEANFKISMKKLQKEG